MLESNSSVRTREAGDEKEETEGEDRIGNTNECMIDPVPRRFKSDPERRKPLLCKRPRFYRTYSRRHVYLLLPQGPEDLVTLYD